MNIGDVYGSLIVVDVRKTELPGQKWKQTLAFCKCACGADYQTEPYNLRAGKVKSCGCKNRIKNGESRPVKDLTGQKFGRLAVREKGPLKPSGKYGGMRQTWVCDCECGKTHTAVSSDLISGNTRSCGCLLQEATRTADYYSVVSRLRAEVDKAGKFEWLLDTELAVKLVQQDCYYCDLEPRPSARFKHLKFNGLDRIDSTQGYTDTNVRTCCIRCNTAKNNQTEEAFFAQVKRIHDKHLKKD